MASRPAARCASMTAARQPRQPLGGIAARKRQSEPAVDPGHVRYGRVNAQQKSARISPTVRPARSDARGVTSVRCRSCQRAMGLGIVVFGAAFLVGLGLGTWGRRPLSTAFLVLGSFTALLMLVGDG